MTDDSRDDGHPFDRSDFDRSDELGSLIREAGPRPTPPIDATHRVRKSLEATWRSYSRRRRAIRALRYSSAMAAALLLSSLVYFAGVRGLITKMTEPDAPSIAAVMIIGDVSSRGTGADTETHRVAPGAELEVGRILVTEATSAAKLEIGSAASLRIDENTRLRIDSAWAYHLEYGRIYLDVSHADESIVIATPFGTVRDIGTRFEVVVSDRKLSVRVREGEVQMRTQSRELTLSRGQAAETGPKFAITATSEAPYGPTWQWLRRLATPPTEQPPSVAALAEWFAAEEGFRLRYASEETRLAASEVVIEGDIDALPPENLLEDALASTSFDVQREGDLLIITRQSNP